MFIFFPQDAKNEFFEKMKRGELGAQRLDFLKQNILRPVSCIKSLQKTINNNSITQQ